MKRWYAVHTRPRKEALALANLANQAFDAFFPSIRRHRRIGRRRVAQLEPLFPSYLFVHLDCKAERWRSINGTIGVNRLVAFGSEPTPLPPGLVESFRQLSDSTGELGFDEELQAGDRVRIVGGPFDSVCGTLLTAHSGKRVSVLLEILTQATSVSIPRERLIAG